jgi:hypothetical protein
MDRVESLMENLKLSSAENKGLKIGGPNLARREDRDPQAVGKLLSEKPPFVEGMIRALGGIWCPLHGIRCKELGENIFLFTFLQESGKRKALDEGPWMFNKELLIM